MDTLSERSHEEILTLYQATIEDIERSKQWLWTVTYHTIIAQGGLLALYTAYTSSHTWTKWLFMALCVGIAGVGTSYIHLARKALACFRERINRCLERFEQPFRDALGDRVDKRGIPSFSIILVHYDARSCPHLLQSSCCDYSDTMRRYMSPDTTIDSPNNGGCPTE